jgi:ubiquinone/menaquinone biosynthesis C-methylase UbiE
MTDYADIYANQAAQYERLVAREDYRGAILPALKAIMPLAGSDVVELGAGTGRLTRLLAPHVRSIRAFDASPAMLAVARELLERDGLSNWQLETAEHQHLPAESASADIAIGGWTICYAALWSQDDWHADLAAVIGEIERVLRPNGIVVIIETLGTGYETPHPPDSLHDYYAWLAEQGFQHTWIRTDYRFESPEEAVELTRFFFKELADQMAATGATILPECTGIWWRNGTK